MPRANRYYQQGYVYHITHRCTHRHFLLKFKRDKQLYRLWLFKAVQKYHLCVLNYIITNNHVHLLLLDTGKDIIPNSMCYIASHVAAHYNKRKQLSSGSFWQGRYFATAVQTQQYLLQCMIYIDLNMVRCGAVSHPVEWIYSGYYELQNQRQRYRILNYPVLLKLLQYSSIDEMLLDYNIAIEDQLTRGIISRDPKWTEQPAVGSPDFIANFASSPR